MANHRPSAIDASVGNSHDLRFRGELWAVGNIGLIERELASHLSFELLQDRSEGDASPSGGPGELDEDGTVRVHDLVLVVRIRNGLQ